MDKLQCEENKEGPFSLNYLGMITSKVKGCQWPAEAVEADGAACLGMGGALAARLQGGSAGTDVGSFFCVG